MKNVGFSANERRGMRKLGGSHHRLGFFCALNADCTYALSTNLTPSPLETHLGDKFA